jgi:phage shock protein A
VCELENHDALIAAAINEQHKKITHAKVQMARIKSNEQELRKEIAQLKINEKLWTERAIQEASHNEARAINCLNRRSNIQHEINRLNLMIEEYQKTALKMQNDIHKCEQDFTLLKQKQEILRARQSSVDAIGVINQLGNSNVDIIQDSVGRWESRLLNSEIQYGLDEQTDELEAEYLDQEKTKKLQEELHQLLRHSGNEHAQ